MVIRFKTRRGFSVSCTALFSCFVPSLQNEKNKEEGEEVRKRKRTKEESRNGEKGKKEDNKEDDDKEDDDRSRNGEKGKKEDNKEDDDEDDKDKVEGERLNINEKEIFKVAVILNRFLGRFEVCSYDCVIINCFIQLNAENTYLVT